MSKTLIYACPELSGLNCAFERILAMMNVKMEPSIGYWLAPIDEARLFAPTFYAPQRGPIIDPLTFVVFDRSSGAGALARAYRGRPQSPLITLVPEAELLEHPSYTEGAIEHIDAHLSL